MKKSIVLSLAAVLSLSSINMLSAGGGDAFVGGMAGSMVGSAIAQPREKTVYVQESSDSESYWKEKYYDLKERNRDLKMENKALRKELKKLKGKK